VCDMDRKPIDIFTGGSNGWTSRYGVHILGICFIKEIQWGNGKRYYLTQEPNIDLEPYFLIMHAGMVHIMDSNSDMYYVCFTDAVTKVRKTPTMPAYYWNYNPRPTGSWYAHPDQVRSYYVAHLSWSYNQANAISTGDYNNVKYAVKRYAKNG
jgi:hypothetical protein